MKKTYILIIALLLITLTGCQYDKTAKIGEYKTVAADPTRDTNVACERNARAIKFINENNLKEAEKQLKSALSSDVFFGPAHNNLGNVYFKQKKFYLSAWEFQYAAKLMPNNPEPKNNLALVLETVGKPKQAAEYYEQALKLQPDNTQISANLARLYVTQNKRTERTKQLLEEIILKDTRPKWTTWAKQQLVLRNFNMPKEPIEIH